MYNQEQFTQLEDDEWLENVNDEFATTMKKVEGHVEGVGDAIEKRFKHNEDKDIKPLRGLECRRSGLSYLLIGFPESNYDFFEIKHSYNMVLNIAQVLASDRIQEAEEGEEINLDIEKATEMVPERRQVEIQQVQEEINMTLVESPLSGHDIETLPTGDISHVIFTNRTFVKDDTYGSGELDTDIQETLQTAEIIVHILNKLYNIPGIDPSDSERKDTDEISGEYDTHETRYTE